MYKSIADLMKAEEAFSKLCLLDNSIMNIAFKDNIPAVQHIVRIILDKPDLTVTKVKIQDVVGSVIGHSVTFDIVAVDSKGNRYNIEMQNDASRATEKRARYHLERLGSEMLPKGEDFNEIPDLYVIFITRGAVFGCDLPILHVEQRIRETDKLYEDGSHIIFVNARHNEGSSKLSQLMRDLTASNPEEIKGSKELHDALYCTKSNEEAKDMWIDDYLGPGSDEEYINGVKAEAANETRTECIKSCFNNGVGFEVLSKSFNLPIEEIQKIVGVQA